MELFLLELLNEGSHFEVLDQYYAAQKLQLIWFNNDSENVFGKILRIFLDKIRALLEIELGELLFNFSYIF